MSKAIACAVVAGIMLGWLLAVKLRFPHKDDGEDDAYYGVC